MAADGSQASNYGQNIPIDKPEVVLTGINMPVMDGFEAARTTSNFEQESGCPCVTIIAVTGLGNVAVLGKSFTSRMHLFLTKPVKLKELAASPTEARHNGA